jgi:IS5 family transposase
MLEAVVEPFYPKRGNGCPLFPLSVILRIHSLQQWYSLSDLAAEEALYQTSSIRRFALFSID